MNNKFEKRVVAFFNYANGEKNYILKFKLLDDGRGEFYDVSQGIGENYKKLINQTGISVKGENIKPLDDPKKFIELAPKFYSGTYEGWVWIKQ